MQLAATSRLGFFGSPGLAPNSSSAETTPAIASLPGRILHHGSFDRRSKTSCTRLCRRNTRNQLDPSEHAAKTQASSNACAAAARSTDSSAPRLPAAPMAAYPHPQQQPSYPAQQPSPSTENSPSTVEALPLQTSGPPLTYGAAEAIGRRAPQRAQIACIDCRKSKTKCNNLGLGTTCKACAAKNKQCVYNEGPVVSTGDGSSRRRESSIGGVDVSHHRTLWHQTCKILSSWTFYINCTEYLLVSCMSHANTSPLHFFT